MPHVKPSDHAAELARIDHIAHLMDARFRLFGIRFGWDSIIGLIPGLGDTLVVAPSAWMIWRAHRLGLGGGIVSRMAANTAVDYVLGLVPILGDIFDVGFKANLRNADLLRGGLDAQSRKRQTPGA